MKLEKIIRFFNKIIFFSFLINLNKLNKIKQKFLPVISIREKLIPKARFLYDITFILTHFLNYKIYLIAYKAKYYNHIYLSLHILI